MYIPERLPGLRVATVLIAIYAFVWLSFEGNLNRVILLAAGASFVSAGHFIQRWLGGRLLPAWLWLLVAAGVGAGVGLGSNLLTLVLMAVKTGVHAHGPEFTAGEIAWVRQQLALWFLAGLAAGAGSGLVAWYGRPTGPTGTSGPDVPEP